jgi:hypothetical protein
MELFELKLEDLLKHGVFKISLVGSPAMEADWIKLSKQFTLAKVDSEKRIIVGPAMIPNKRILRIDKDGTEYEIFFSPETIEAAAHKYLMDANQHAVNVEHEINIGGVTTVESWIVDNPDTDKAKSLGFDVPKGTWMIAMKVQDERVWEDLIKSGLLNGFSIEGVFQPIEPEDAELTALLSEVQQLLKKL